MHRGATSQKFDQNVNAFIKTTESNNLEGTHSNKMVDPASLLFSQNVHSLVQNCAADSGKDSGIDTIIESLNERK